MYDDDDFLISSEDIARLRASKDKKLDEDDEEMLQLLASLDNGSSDEQGRDWEYTNWDDVVKQFLSTYKISRSDWKKIVDRVQKMKKAQPSKQVWKITGNF